jgi:phosphoribosylanthranilate isomerase
MSLWIKICGNTSLEDALLAADAGADAVGFVFATSPRQVTVEQVAALTPRLPSSLEKIGVFVDAKVEEIETIIRTCGLTGVQLHSNVGLEGTASLRERFGRNLRILRVLHYSPSLADEAAGVAGNSNFDAVLLDSRTAAAVGGTGIAFDWDAAAAALTRSQGFDHKIVVAGGLNPANVAEAIQSLHPWGVDVVSGVEASRGRKDPEKVRAFIARARAAVTR